MRIVQHLIFVFAAVLFLAGCSNPKIPKPYGYFRIALPEKKYIHYDAPCSYSIEYPAYSVINLRPGNAKDTCWMDIEFPTFKAKIHLTYFTVNNNLSTLTESARELAYKHTIKADAIEEKVWTNDSTDVYGILYDLKGNTASAVQFFVTDSTRHYLRGSLYFMAEPNEDSLLPVITFLRQDIVHLIETLNWK